MFSLQSSLSTNEHWLGRELAQPIGSALTRGNTMGLHSTPLSLGPGDVTAACSTAVISLQSLTYHCVVGGWQGRAGRVLSKLTGREILELFPIVAIIIQFPQI